jgi:hypothetical protein
MGGGIILGIFFLIFVAPEELSPNLGDGRIRRQRFEFAI